MRQRIAALLADASTAEHGARIRADRLPLVRHRASQETGAGRGCVAMRIVHRATHFAVTASVPAAVRAKRSGRYMSSTVAAGCTNEPGVTARTM